MAARNGIQVVHPSVLNFSRPEFQKTPCIAVIVEQNTHNLVVAEPNGGNTRMCRYRSEILHSANQFADSRQVSQKN
jgi:hypothetical protein